MEMVRPPKSFLEIRGADYALDHIAGNQFRIAFAKGISGYRGKAGIKVMNSGVIWRGSTFVTIEDSEPDQLKVTCEGTATEQRQLKSVMNWACGRSSFYAEDFDDEVAKPARYALTLSLGSFVRTLALGCLAAALVVLIAFVVTQKKASFQAELAFVGFPSTDLKATTAGEVIFVRQDGAVERGELFASLKTPAGFAKFIESTRQGAIASVATKPGTFVHKGATLMRLADENARPYIAAFVRQDQLKQALNAKTIHVTFTQSHQSLQFSGEDGFYPRNRRLISNETGSILAEIEFSVPEGIDVPTGEPLTVEFITTDQDASSFIRQHWHELQLVWQRMTAVWGAVA